MSRSLKKKPHAAKLLTYSSALLALGLSPFSTASAAVYSHTGSSAATHMQLKKNGNVVCSAYNTSSSSAPVARNCPSGSYTEQLFNSSWRQIGKNKPVTIGGTSSSSTHTGSAAATHMQLKNSSGSIVCSAYNTNSRSAPVATNCPNGTFTEQLFNSNWRQIGGSIDVTIGGTSSDTGYYEIFRDDFNGNNISSNFFLADWAIGGRATTNSLEACSQSGGVLSLKAQNAGNQIQACYLISNKRDIGPGDSSTIKIEYLANVSQVRARGAWFAGWVYPLGEGGPAEDGDPSNGAEFDVFEYMPTNATAYNTAVHDGGKTEKWIYRPQHGANLTDNRFHTYSMEWNKNCAVFSFDGTPVNKITQRISKEPVHSIYLSMEGQTGRQWNNWNVGSLSSNLRSSPAVGKISMVRVLQKDTVDNLCQTTIPNS